MAEIDALVKQLGDRDLAVLLNAKNDLQKKMVASPTSENIKALAAVNKTIEEYQRKSMVADDITFKNLKDVIGYLQENYFGIKQSTIYYHKKKGRLVVRDSGYYHLEDVVRYGDLYFTKKATGEANGGPIEYDGLKDEAITKKAAAQAEHWEIKTKILRGDYIERSAFERALARRAAIFKSDIENFIRTYCAEMIHIVKGDSTYLPDLTEFWLDKSEDWLARYAEKVELEIPAAVDLSRLETHMEN